MDFEKIMDITNGVNLKEDDFKDINIELNDLELKTMEKTILVKINNHQEDNIKTKKINFFKKHSKKIAASFALVTFLGASCAFLSKPAFAENIEVFQNIYEKLGYYRDYKDYSEFIGQSKEDNGYRFTIEKLIGTPNKMLVAVKVTSLNKPFDKDAEKSIVKNLMPSVGFSFKVAKDGSGSSNIEYIDDYNAVYVFSEDIPYGKFNKRGNVTINIHSYGIEGIAPVNVNFNFKADFSKSFNKTLNLKVNKKVTVGKTETTISEISSSLLGTFLKFDEFGHEPYDQGSLAIEVDGKIYLDSNFGAGSDGAYSFFPALTYDVLNKTTSIKVIPINRADFSKEVQTSDNKYEIALKTNLKEPLKITNISGAYGEIYKIEHTADKIRVYYDAGDKTLGELSLARIYSHYKNPMPEEYNNSTTIIVKDENRKNGYYIEQKAKPDKEYFFSRSYPSVAYKAGDPLIVK
ncbi:protein of unknown function [Clostridium cavendishii DSM 21758]|uniref:DUF4179 domain-containing protein n=1 Tax=Clostridium cavendishii DSM 21758 TaxID=1121302 RepID=A0A1M6JDK0_9CLOT|nr:DUF4179 domain-containing protein [Clostridium cavendishii]SHJ44720.1 protein of unknown function [Clostridium cavendishii DSM 21758]